jgi:glycosyltransferase involved in cell wall biosynthesis
MCCYNSAQYINETIDSVLGQSYKDYEFIIWNDGSTDNTEEVVKQYSDSRIKYFYHENTGLGLALNMACNKAVGKYIARIDADDICMPDRMAIQIGYLEKRPSVALVSSLAEYIDEKGSSLGYGICYTSPRLIRKNLNGIFHPAVMMRTDVYRKTGGYPPLRRSQDLFLWYRISKFGDLRIISYPLIKYRISNNAISSKASQYYLDNVSDLWRILAAKPNLKESDFDYLNLFIKDCSLESAIRKSPVNNTEKKLFIILSSIFPYKIVFFLITRMKNLYGFVSI